MSDTRQGDPTMVAGVEAGDLLAEELQKLGQLQQRINEIIYQLGTHRVHEQRLLGNLVQTEQIAQNHLNQVGARLGIPDGTPWQVVGGKAVLVRQGG